MKKYPRWLRVMILGSFFCMLFVFAGCVQPTIEVPKEENPAVTVPETKPETPKTETTSPYFVKNSKWESVDISTLPARSASLSLDQALEIVEAYNAENNDNQLFLDTVDVPIKEAPTVNVYIVNEGDYILLAEYIGLDRSDFAARRTDFDVDARVYGGLLFIDKVPPVPIIPPDPRTREEKYSIYMVNKYGFIVEYNGFRYEKHIDQIWDSLDEKTKSGYTNGIDDLMDWYVKVFKTDECLMVTDDAPWRVVSGQLYTEPEDPPASE